jgi:hypothetical protein
MPANPTKLPRRLPKPKPKGDQQGKPNGGSQSVGGKGFHITIKRADVSDVKRNLARVTDEVGRVTDEVAILALMLIPTKSPRRSDLMAPGIPT